jgi:Helix-turn-helix domain
VGVTQGELGGAGWSEDAAFGGRLRPFSRDGYVLWSEDGARAEVFVGSTLIGMFERQEPRARNLILIGLCQGRRVRVGRLARAFGITDETLRKVRRRYDKEGLAGLVGGKSRGRAPKLSGASLQAVHRWFTQGLTVREVQQKLKGHRPPVSVSVGTLSNERARWKRAQRTRSDDGAVAPREAPPSEPPEGRSQGDAQRALPMQLDRAPTSAATAVSDEALPALVADAPAAPSSSAPPPEPSGCRSAVEPAGALLEPLDRAPTTAAAAGEAAPVFVADAPAAVAPAAGNDDEDKGAELPIEGALPQSGRFVQHVGAWLMLAMVWTMGLHGRFEKERTREEREGRQLRATTVRVALDALVIALAVGQRCIEGVRRLQTSTASKLLRASAPPTASWVRRVLGILAAQHGAAHVALATAGAHLRAAQAAKDAERPVIFYFDNHVRPYTGHHVVRKGWRMQDRRARPGITDFYVHDQHGSPVFRIDSPQHEPLTSLMPKATMLLRAALGAEERILVAFDRGGAFPTQLAALRDDGLEFVTYERRPFAKLPKRAFTETLTFAEDDVVHWCEAPDKNLKAGRGRVRRVAVLDNDGRQINVLAISEAPAQWLIGVMRGRWQQENGFKHGGERWGQNQLDARTVHPCDPAAIIPNPARRRLDRDLKLSRAREGEARRRLALLAPDAPGRAAHERDLEQALATQSKLLAERANLPTHARLDETDLADELVSHDPDFKLLVDGVRATCINAESDLAARLAPHMKYPDEAKKLLANIFTAPGEVRVCATAITIVLDCAANGGERTAIAELLSEITAAKLTLPGDPSRRPLAFRAQPFDR